MPIQDEDERNLFSDYRRRQVRIPPPKPMGDVMSQLLARRGYAQVQTAASCEAAWRTAVGDKLAAQTRPGNIRRGVLEVLVGNSSVLQELAFLKSKVIKQLAQLAPDQKIRDVRFRVGPIE
jgi:predicted nucleic acid-binding Zn ribbon protein